MMRYLLQKTKKLVSPAFVRLTHFKAIVSNKVNCKSIDFLQQNIIFNKTTLCSMKLSILFLLLFISVVGFSQSRDFDFEIELDEDNSIFLQGKEISKNTLKKVFQSSQGEEPNILLKYSEGVSQTQIERIKRLASKEFETYRMTLDFPPIKVHKDYQYFVSGRVQDELNQPLKHIAVVAKGTRTGLLTDENGDFKIGIPKATESLVVQHKDFKAFELTYNQLASLKNTDELVITLTAR